MRKHADEVVGALRGIEEISSSVKDAMGEMELGTQEINGAMMQVTDLQAKSGESVERLYREVSAFRTADEAPPA